MELTGWPDGPALGGPPALVDLVERAAGVVDRRSEGRAAVDGLALLGERAALGNLTRRGRVSCGGSTRLVRTADSWLAVSLARPDDVSALEAWLGADVPPEDPWPAVERIAGESDAAALDERAALLGLPIAALSSVGPPASAPFGLPIGAACLHEAAGPARPIEGARVLDLSSLWAGPLCGQLLATAGATVVKVESSARPDGARQGPAAFFDLMNGLKLSVALDLATPDGRCDLRRLINAADVVIESARPRGLEQMGIMAAEVLGRPAGPRAGSKVWASITSHGRGPGRAERVGFGDVAAVAGGLVGPVTWPVMGTPVLPGRCGHRPARRPGGGGRRARGARRRGEVAARCRPGAPGRRRVRTGSRRRRRGGPAAAGAPGGPPGPSAGIGHGHRAGRARRA